MSAPRGHQGEIFQAPSGAQKVPQRVPEMAGMQVKRTILKKIKVRPKITLFETFGVQASSKGLPLEAKWHPFFKKKRSRVVFALRVSPENSNENASGQKASKI